MCCCNKVFFLQISYPCTFFSTSSIQFQIMTIHKKRFIWQLLNKAFFCKYCSVKIIISSYSFLNLLFCIYFLLKNKRSVIFVWTLNVKKYLRFRDILNMVTMVLWSFIKKNINWLRLQPLSWSLKDTNDIL